MNFKHSLFESDFFDNNFDNEIENDDLLSDNSHDSLPEGNYGLIWYGSEKNYLLSTMKSVFLSKLDKRQETRYDYYVSMTPKLKNVTLYCPVVNDDDSIDFVELKKACAKQMIIHGFGIVIKFDYDTSRKNDVGYMLDLLENANKLLINITILLKIEDSINVVKNFMSLTYFTDKSYTPKEFYNANKSAVTNADFNRLKYSVNISSDLLEHIQTILSHLDSSLTAKDIRKYISSRFSNENKTMNALMSQNVSLNIIRKLYIDDRSRKRDKILIIKVPENTKLCLDDVSLDSLKTTLRLNGIVFQIDGTLVIKSIDGFSNLKYAEYSEERDNENDALKVLTVMSPNILKFILTKVYFKSLDLSHADMTEDMSVNLNYKLVLNPDIEIESNRQLEIKR